jgi:hypothetical protein
MAVKGHGYLVSTEYWGVSAWGNMADVIELPARQLLLPGSQSEWYFRRLSPV